MYMHLIYDGTTLGFYDFMMRFLIAQQIVFETE